MADAGQVAVVTLAAAIALAVLLRPLLPGFRSREGPPPRKPAGCSACEKDPAKG